MFIVAENTGSVNISILLQKYLSKFQKLKEYRSDYNQLNALYTYTYVNQLKTFHYGLTFIEMSCLFIKLLLARDLFFSSIHEVTKIKSYL